MLAFFTWLVLSVVGLREWRASHEAWGAERAADVSADLAEIKAQLTRIEDRLDVIQKEGYHR